METWLTIGLGIGNGGKDTVLNQNENTIKETLCLDCGF